MSFSNQELKLIGHVQRRLRYYRRGILYPTEFASSILHAFAQADADGVIPHCLALLSSEVRRCIAERLAELESSDYQGNLVVYLGTGPTEAEEAWLAQRYRVFAPKVVESCRRFSDTSDPPAELAVPKVDLFWEHLKGMRPGTGATCEVPGCGRPTVRVGVFCARHHYERIEGKPPPDY